MRAVRVTRPGDVTVLDVSSPEPANGEVLLEVTACAVCSTDRKFAAREHGSPRTLGHEVTGRLPDGKAVGVHPEIACRQCQACRAGWHNRCRARAALGMDRDGGLAELVAVPSTQLALLGDLDPVIATLLEPLGCAVHAVDVAGIDNGQPAVVVGAGAMGILCAWVLQAAGSRVVACQRSPERRRLARDLGIDAAIGPDEDPADRLGEPPAAAVVTAPGPEALAWALERVAVGGVVQVFASGPGGAQVDANIVHYRHLTLVGSTGSRFQDYERAHDLAASGAIKLDRLPHRVVGLGAAPAAVLDRPPDGVLKTIVMVS
jgi:threonine dehydrogenase-like Zn-dependent dehydrogenase